jgi:hypothetical protein
MADHDPWLRAAIRRGRVKSPRMHEHNIACHSGQLFHADLNAIDTLSLA